jgi:hypothetical protein
MPTTVPGNLELVVPTSTDPPNIGAVQTAFQRVQDTLGVDSGFVSIDLVTNWTGTMVCRKVGGSGWLSMLITRSGTPLTDVSSTLGQIPAGSIPSGTWAFDLMVGNNARAQGLISPATGVISYQGLTIAVGQTLRAHASWPLGY